MASADVTLTNAPANETPLRQIARLSWRSWIGINAANFFLAEVTGVTLPFVTTYLQEADWQPFAIGLAAAAAGLGVFLAQTPAGFVTDRFRHRRSLLAAASLLLGACYVLLPSLPARPILVDSLLFVSGVGQAFFLPLLGAMALGLVGRLGLNRMMGVNQGFNHAGNLAAAATAVLLIRFGGLSAVFDAVFIVSLFAAGSVFLMRTDELNETRAAGTDAPRPANLRSLLRDRRVAILFASTALFHLANAPVMPLAAQRVKDLNGTHTQVAWVVLIAQAVMIPVSLSAGRLVDRWGRKPVFAVGFAVLPIRIGLYAFATSPEELIAIQTLDGVGAGIYGVAVVAMIADLTKGKGGFNTLAGIIATALSIGGVVGPIGTGALTQYLSYGAAFGVFAVIAAIAAFLFIGFMPETQPRNARPE